MNRLISSLCLAGLIGGATLTVVPNQANAGLLDFLGVTSDLEDIKDRIIGDLIKEFRARADQLMVDGQNTGNALLVQAGNEAMLAINSAEVIAARQMDIMLNRLDDQQEEVFGRINAVLDRLDGFEAGFVELGDLLVLDIEQLVSRVPFAEDAELYIRRVRGLVVPPTSSPRGHIVQITGSGFGADVDGNSIDIRVEIDGVDQGFETYSSGKPNIVELALQEAWVAEKRQSDELVVIPITIIATRTEKPDGLFSNFQSDTVSTSELSLRLTILPEIAGEIRPIYSETAKTWVPNEPLWQRKRPMAGGEVFPIQSGPAVIGGQPKLGDVRFIPGTAQWQCHTDIRDAYKFPSKVLAATHPIFTDGWTSLKKEYECLPRLGMWNQTNSWSDTSTVFTTQQTKAARREFGVSRKTVARYLRNFKRNPSRACTIPPAILKSWATRLDYDFSTCPQIKPISAEPDPDQTTVNFRFSGDPSVTATYTVTAQFERYAYDTEAPLIVTEGDWVDVRFGTNELSIRSEEDVATRFEFQPVWSPKSVVFLNTQMDTQPGFSNSQNRSQGATDLFLFSYNFSE